MHLITISDTGNIGNPEIHRVGEGVSLADWLINHYANDGFELPTQIYKGTISDHTVIDYSVFANVDVEITDNIFIIHQPLGLSPLAQQVLIAVIAAVAVTILMPVPDIAGLGRTQRRSPNNALTGQQNIARTLDRVPDIFGRVKSYPDLIAPTVTQFINHIKFQCEYLCISRGYLDIENIRSGDSLISDIPGSNSTTYGPGQSPVEVLKTRQSNEVASQELRAPNDQPVVAMDATFSGTYDLGTDKATLIAPSGGAWGGISALSVVILIEVYMDTGSVEYALAGIYSVDSVTPTTIVLADAATVVPAWTNFDAITESILIAIGPAPLPVEPTVRLNDSVVTIGPFALPGGNLNTEAWLDFQAQKGMAQGSELNSPITVDWTVELEETDSLGAPLGSSFQVLVSKTEATRDPRFWTEKITALEGFQLNTYYRVSAWRTNNRDHNNPSVLDEIRWTRLVGMQDIAAPDETGTTRISIETQATEQVASIQERRFNCEATRKTVTWDGSSVVGDIETGIGLAASRRMADAFLHYALDPALAARAVTDVDAVNIYSIQAAMDADFSGELGEFNHTFDNKDAPALEEMRTIAQACRCALFREGSVFNMVRDEDQPFNKALFTRRNKKPYAETRSIRFNRPLDHDGVTLEYNDIDDNIVRTITLPDDLPPTDEHYTQPPAINPLTITEGVGIRQYYQAWNRCQLEYRKLIYKRVSIETSVSLDGALVNLNSRIAHVDGTRLATLTSDGEVKSINGLTVTTDQRCTFGDDTYSVILRDELGNPSDPIIATARTDTDFGFILSSLPVFAIVTRGDNDYQRGTLYSLAPDAAHLAVAYLVQTKESDERGNITFNLINYATEYYAADGRTPPDKALL